MRFWRKVAPQEELEAHSNLLIDNMSPLTEEPHISEAAAPAHKKIGLPKPSGKTIRRGLATLLISVVYILLLFFLFRNAAGAYRNNVAASLRYHSPLPAAQVANAKYTMAGLDTAAGFSAAFWYESGEETLATERAEATSPVLFVDGDMETVLWVDFLFGSYPSALEDRSVALSEGLAWELFGGSDIEGATFSWNGKEYVVRGVFSGEQTLMLAQIKAEDASVEGFAGVELAGDLEEAGDPREQAKSFAAQVGLGEPDVVVGARTLPGILQAMAWLPVGIFLLWVCIQLLKLLRHVTYWKRQLVWLGILLALAVLLPRAMGALPGWMIPNQWSNLEHWREFIKEMNARLTEWFSLWPYTGDVQLKKQLILQLVLLVPAMFTVTAMIGRWKLHIWKKDKLQEPGQAPVPTDNMDKQGDSAEQTEEQEEPLLPEGQAG